MTKAKIISAVLSLSFAMSGCDIFGAKTAPTASDASTNYATDTSSEADTASVPFVHTITVEDMLCTTLKDDHGEYKARSPKLIVDGEEAVDFDLTISRIISNTYSMKPDPDNDNRIVGEQVDYVWGTYQDIVSVVLIINRLEDGLCEYDAYSYNVDTMEFADNDDLLALYGISRSEFCRKVEDIYRKWWKAEPGLEGYEDMLEDSIKEISLDRMFLFVMPNGHLGFADIIRVPDQGLWPYLCFDFETQQHVKLSIE